MTTAAGVHVFGVRHLSPAGAWHLRALLDAVRPTVVLVEGPVELATVAADLVRSGTRPPVAVLAYTADVPVRTLVYPLAAYSPEYQALKWADDHNARVEFIDLPTDIFLGLQDQEIERHQRSAGVPWTPEPGRSVYDRLAERAGEPDYDTYWERRFEHTRQPDAYRAAATAFGRELRDEPDPPAWRAENLVREAFMRRRIAEVLATGVAPGKVVAVVGAFHAPVLGPELPAMTDAELAALPRRASKLTLMPYSYFKLSTQSGYGAGNRAPAYFERVWHHADAAPDEVPHHYLTEVARHLRATGTPRSAAEVIEGVRLARTLAALGGGSAPTLADLHDAAVTLLGRGDRGVVAEALARTDVGTAVGELPAGVSRTSIQDDFDRQLKQLKLDRYRKPVAEDLALDLRENRHVKTAEAAFLDRHRSSFLHRLRVLGVGFGVPQATNQQQATWAERWVLKWTPENEIALVEAVLLGETVELATGFRFTQVLEAAADIGAAAEAVRDACLCGLPAAADAARRRVQELAAGGGSLTAVAYAASQLSQVVRYGDVRGFDPTPLLPLVEELFVQGALGLHAAAACDNAAAAKLADALDQLNRVSLDHHDRVDGDLWSAKLQALAAADDRNPLLSGLAAAVLLERGLMAGDELAREVSRRLSPGVPADLGAGWFEGLSRRNRPALLARQPLWQELAGYLARLDADEFRRAVVFLRRAFGGFSPVQKRQVCENLAEHWGLHADAAEGLAAPLSDADQQKLDELSGFDFTDI